MQSLCHTIVAVATVALLSTGTHAFAQPKKPRAASATLPDIDGGSAADSKREAAFAKKMSNATLVGSFTVDGKGAGKPPKPERYELGTVKKLKNDKWLWTAKIKYGGKKGTKIAIPIPLTMKWAGDTPVITMTNFTIPTMGTFTARVLFYGDRYVGTWQHGKVGGHMFGKIEPAKSKTLKAKSDSKSDKIDK